MTQRSPSGLISTGIVLVAGTALLLSGCVRRRMTIRSSPPGATVYVDNYELGPTPRSINFTHYGTRQIRLVKDGYETLTLLQPVPAPWYQLPVLDFFSENLHVFNGDLTCCRLEHKGMGACDRQSLVIPLLGL